MAIRQGTQLMQKELPSAADYRAKAEKLRLKGDNRLRYQLIAEYYGCDPDTAFALYHKLLTEGEHSIQNAVDIQFDQSSPFACVYTDDKRKAELLMKHGLEPIQDGFYSAEAGRWMFEIPKWSLRIKMEGEKPIVIGGYKPSKWNPQGTPPGQFAQISG